MDYKNYDTEFEESTKICRLCGTQAKTEKKNRNSRKIWALSAITIGVIILTILFVFIILGGTSSASDDKVGDSLFYTKNGKVYYTSIDEIAPVEVISPNGKVLDRSFSYYDIFSIQVSEDGRKLFYPNNIDLNDPEYHADIFCCDLVSKNHEAIKVGSGINNYVPNQDGSKVYFLKDKDLYVSDLSKAEKIAAGIEELCIDKEGSRLIYMTLDSRLFQYTDNNKEVKEIASNIKLHYASADLKTVYYLKGNDLYLLKDGKDTQMIESDIASVLNIYEDGSLYYLKAHPIITSDYVNDDMAASDAQMSKPNESDYPDRKSYSEAYNKFAKKNARDNLRQLLRNDRIGEINSLYYYSNGKSTMVSDCCDNVWKDTDKIIMPYHSAPIYCGSDRPLLIYFQLKANKINMSDVTGYMDIYNHIMSSVLNHAETYVCSGSEVLKKIADKKPDQLEYDIENNKIYYAVNNYDDLFCYDLYSVTIDGSKVSEARKYAEKAYLLSNFFSVGDSVLYLKNDGSNSLGRDLYVNSEKIDRNVDLPVHRIENTNSFIYASNYKKGGTYELKLYQDRKITKIADSVSLYQYFDNNRIAYVVGTPGNDTAQLYLYDDSQANRLVDPGMSGIFSPVENQYYGYNRPTYPIE